MQFTALLTVAGLAVSAAAQGVTARITPSAPAPSGCSPSYNGEFQISVVNASMPAMAKRAGGDLILKLSNGVLTEQTKMRTGYIASNYQFQFDGPPQDGAIYTAGFSACSNGTLALGGSAIFYQCLSGGFYNLYDRHWAPQCEPIFLAILPYGGASPSVATVVSTGTVNSAATAQRATVTSASFVTQISDSQPQGPTAPVAQTSTYAVVTMISDGQPQGPRTVATAMPKVVSAISDGQPQAPTAAVVSAISDGQPQAPTGRIVSAISDGQPQAPTAAVVSAISDGQPQAPTGRIVSAISDGQPQAPTATVVRNATVATPTARYTGAASSVQAGSAFAVVFGAIAAAFL